MDMSAVLAGGAPPLLAILRGLRPAEAEAVGAALVDGGIRLIEVPLNSPEPFESITRLQAAFGDRAAIGAGTVLGVADVDRLAATGAQLCVSPHADPRVIAHAVARGLVAMPGVLTPTEAFAAIAAGARRLKLFPASSVSPAYLRALREVLPPDVEVWAVGGAGAQDARAWLDAGAAGLGVGSGLYRPGDAPELVGARARALVAACARGAGA